MARRWQWCLLLFLAFLSLSLAASPTSFCKCTCFNNSTIIALHETPKGAKSGSDSKSKGRTCMDCNKQFCLDYNLSICEKATEDDVFTTCFQRDSTKDEAVVFIFIFATVGLLAWAGVRPWVEKWRQGTRVRQTYTSVPGENNGQQ